MTNVSRGTIEEQVARIPEASLRAITKIITHAGCPDGIASAMLLRQAFPELPIEFVYHGTAEHAQPPCAALFCDFSPPDSNAREWVEAGAVILDHHATAKSVVELFGERGVFADEHEHPGVSGALLAWELADRMGKIPWAARGFAELVGIRDTWQRDNSSWDHACHLTSALTFFGADYWMKHGLPDHGHVEAGRVVHERRLARANEIASSTVDDLYLGRSFLLFNDGREKLSSDVAEAASELGRPWHFVAGFFYTEDGSLVFSLRSVAPAFDVSKIATVNGGGGHTRAAGFQVACSFGDSPAGAMARALDRVRG